MRASLAQVGGFRPPDDPRTSWAGTVKLAAPGEDWPVWNGTPMHGVLQLVTAELPVCPDALRGVALLTLFVDEEMPIDTPNGDGWRLRTYQSLDGLVELPRPTWARDPLESKTYDPALKPFPLRFSEIDEDEPEPGLKIGGVPYEVQDEVMWPIPDVEFVLQVDSDAKTRFVVVDSGVFYVGRQRATGEWRATWQSL